MSTSSNTEKRPGKLALEGIRVLDFTIGGAGPFATKLFADNGAEVIKVETSTHYDFPRTMGPYAGGVKGVNRSAYFTNRNSGKRSIAINLKKKEAAETLKRIIPTVDIVANNFRAGVLEKLGFGYQQLAAMRPDLIYISMPLQGSAGPYAVAAALVDGTAGVAQFMPDRLFDPVIRRVLPKVEVVSSDEFTAAYKKYPPEHHTTVEVELVDGRRVIGEAGGAKGDMANSATEEIVTAKFRELCEPLLGQSGAARALDMLSGIVQLTQLDDVANAFVVPS